MGERQTDSHPNRGAERRTTETRDELSKETIRSEFEQKTAAGRVASLVRLVAPVSGYIYIYIYKAAGSQPPCTSERRT